MPGCRRLQTFFHHHVGEIDDYSKMFNFFLFSALALHALRAIQPACPGHRKALPPSTEMASILNATFAALVASVPRMRMVVDSAHARPNDFDDLRSKQMFRFSREYFIELLHAFGLADADGHPASLCVGLEGHTSGCGGESWGKWGPRK